MICRKKEEIIVIYEDREEKLFILVDDENVFYDDKGLWKSFVNLLEFREIAERETKIGEMLASIDLELASME